MDADQLFAEVVAELSCLPGVEPPGAAPGWGFGSGALKVNGSIFAMLMPDQLVVKLPRQRVDELIEAGTGRAFDANKGRPMKEWLAVGDFDLRLWRTLSREALEFGRSRPSRSQRR